MTVNSTEQERYAEIKDRILCVTPWSPDKELVLNDENETYAHALRRHAEELRLFGTKAIMDGMDIPAVFTKKTLGESINITVR